MLQIMGRLRDGTSEIMCHPSADEAAMEACFHWGYHGSRELEALLSPEVRAAVREKRIRLISYRDLAEEQQFGGILNENEKITVLSGGSADSAGSH